MDILPWIPWLSACAVDSVGQNEQNFSFTFDVVLSPKLPGMKRILHPVLELGNKATFDAANNETLEVREWG